MIEPSYDYPSIVNLDAVAVKNKVIFDNITKLDIDSGYNPATHEYIKLRMTTFNYYKASNRFRVLLRAENNNGDARDEVVEFYFNDPPRTSLLYLSTNEKYHNYTMQSVFNITTSGWYDNSSDTLQELSFKYYVIYDTTIFMVQPSMYRLSNYIGPMPFFTNSYTYIEVDIYAHA